MIRAIKSQYCKVGEFKLKSGKETNLFFDLGSLSVRDFESFHIQIDIGKLIYPYYDHVIFGGFQDIIFVPVPTGGNHLAYYLNNLTSETANINSKIKDFPCQYVIIEDVVTTGNSAIEVAKKFNSQFVISILNRGGEEAEYNFLENGIIYKSILILEDIVGDDINEFLKWKKIQEKSSA